MLQRRQQNSSRLVAVVGLAIGFLFVGAAILRAAWTEPTQAPPAGNVPVPIYSVGPSQSVDGSLSAGTPGSYTTGLAGTGSTSGVQGNSTAGNAVFGNLAAGGAGGQRAIYGLAVDANDYALYASGGLGIGLASGDIWFSQQGSGISWPRESDGTSLYGLYVAASGELQIRGHGAGINFMDQNTNSRLTISEAGVVNVASGGALKVNSVNVCLQDGTNCSAAAVPNLQGVTDQGSVTTNTLDLKGGINNSAGDLVINDWADVQWGLKNSTANNNGNLYISDDFKVTGAGEFVGDLKVGGGGAFGAYNPSAVHKVTTPTLYSEQAQIGGATGGLKGAGALNAVQLCIQGNCKSTDWGTVASTRVYIDLPLIDNNDYLCAAGYVMVGVKNTNPAKLICERMW